MFTLEKDGTTYYINLDNITYMAVYAIRTSVDNNFYQPNGQYGLSIYFVSDNDALILVYDNLEQAQQIAEGCI